MNKTGQNPLDLYMLLIMNLYGYSVLKLHKDFMDLGSYSKVITWPPQPSSGSVAVASSPPPPSLAASSPLPPVSHPSVSVALPAASVSLVSASPAPVVVSVSAFLSL